MPKSQPSLFTKAYASTFGKFFPRGEGSSSSTTVIEREPESRIIRDTVSDVASPTQFPSLFSIYKRNPWIYSATNVVASSCLAVPLRLRDRATKRIIAPTETVELGRVLKYPNPFMTQMELMELLFLHLEIVGNAFWEIVTDVTKTKLVAIFPLDPTRITIIPDRYQYIRGYKYSVDSGREIDFKRDDIVHFKYPDPQNEYWGLAPSLINMRLASLENKLKIYGEKFFDNDATPSIVLKTDRVLSDSTYERLRRRWLQRHSGVQNKFSIAILEDGMSFEKVGTALADVDWTAIRDSIRDEVLVASGVPPTLLGVPGVSNYASARVAQSMFFDSNIAPRLRKIAQIIDKDITNRFNSAVETVFDTSVAPINVVKLSANSRVVSRLYSLDLMTKNEARSLLGLTPVDNGDNFKSDKATTGPEGSGTAASGEAEDPGETGESV